MTNDVSRRRFLGGLGAVTLMGLAGGPAQRAFALPAASAATATIDVHGHVLPPFWVQALRASGANRVSGMQIPQWSPALAANFLDAHAIDTQVVALPDPAVTFLPALADRVAMAQRVNDYVAAELVKSPAYCGRFGGFVTLPLSDLSAGEQAAAITEARRGITELGLDGVSILSNYGEKFLGDPTLAPLMTALNALGAVVAVHSNAQGTAPATDLGAPLLEAPFNTTRAIVNMSYLQTFTLYPNIKWLFVDAGGTLPYLAYRTSLFLLYPAFAQNFGIDAGHLDQGNFQFRNLYYDTAWSANDVTMASLREIAPDEHILLGTDWPLSALALPTTGPAQPSLSTIFTGNSYAEVTGANALQLLPGVTSHSAPQGCAPGQPTPTTSPLPTPQPQQHGRYRRLKRRHRRRRHRHH